jgi:hypothetical protein
VSTLIIIEELPDGALVARQHSPTDCDALDRASGLLGQTDPALLILRIECNDGSSMDDATFRRLAREPLD